MTWTYQTALTVDECLALLENTEYAYESFTVQKRGNEFRVWRDRRLFDYMSHARRIDPILDGALYPIANGTRIDLKIADVPERSAFGLVALSVAGVIVASLAVLSSLYQKTQQDATKVCLGSCFFLVVVLPLLIYFIFRNNSVDNSLQNDLVEFVALKLNAKVTENKTFGKPQIVQGKFKA